MKHIVIGEFEFFIIICLTAFFYAFIHKGRSAEEIAEERFKLFHQIDNNPNATPEDVRRYEKNERENTKEQNQALLWLIPASLAGYITYKYVIADPFVTTFVIMSIMGLSMILPKDGWKEFEEKFDDPKMMRVYHWKTWIWNVTFYILMIFFFLSIFFWYYSFIRPYT